MTSLVFFFHFLHFCLSQASSSAAPTEPPEVFVPVFDRDDSLWDGRGDNTTEVRVC